MTPTTQLADIVKLFIETSCSQKLLTKHDNSYLPIYSIQAFEEANKPLHLGVIYNQHHLLLTQCALWSSIKPYSAEEKFQMMSAKVRADVSGEQSRMDAATALWNYQTEQTCLRRYGAILLGFSRVTKQDEYSIHA